MISSLRKEVLELTRQQRINNAYMFLYNEALAMQIDLQKLLEMLYAMDKELLKEELKEVEEVKK